MNQAKLTTSQLKKILVLALFFPFVVVALFLTSQVGRSGKIAVTVEVLPKDSQVMLDGKEIDEGTIYLAPKTYTFTAAKAGFETVSVNLTVTEDNHYVGLLPKPASADAENWAAKEDVWPERERIAGRRSETLGKETALRNPLLDKLPYSDIMGPFTVDYAFLKTDSTKTRVVIYNSTENGRIKALQWIRSQGVDPADLMIEFEDFDNPTSRGDV